MSLMTRSLVVLVVAGLTMLAVPIRAQEQNVAQGHLLRLDLDARKIVIRTESGSQMQFDYTDETVVDGADETIAGLGSRKGMLLTVKYEKQEIRFLALQVNVQNKL